MDERDEGMVEGYRDAIDVVMRACEKSKSYEVKEELHAIKNKLYELINGLETSNA